MAKILHTSKTEQPYIARACYTDKQEYFYSSSLFYSNLLVVGLVVGCFQQRFNVYFISHVNRCYWNNRLTESSKFFPLFKANFRPLHVRATLEYGNQNRVHFRILFVIHMCTNMRMRILWTFRKKIFKIFTYTCTFMCLRLVVRTCTNGCVHIQLIMALPRGFCSVTGLLRTTQCLLRRSICTGTCSQQQTGGKSEEKIKDGNGRVTFRRLCCKLTNINW